MAIGFFAVTERGHHATILRVTITTELQRVSPRIETTISKRVGKARQLSVAALFLFPLS
jgi:hypothetical protein